MDGAEKHKRLDSCDALRVKSIFSTGAQLMYKKSASQSGFLNLCVLIGLLVFIASVLLAVFSESALGRIRRSEAKPQASVDTTAGVIPGQGLATPPTSTPTGGCQYAITFGVD